MQPLQPHPHQQKRNAVFKYKPFLVSFILTFVFLITSIPLFVQANYVCGDNCLTYYSFYFSCVRGGALYCCSYYEYTAPDRCGTSFASCYLDNTVCGTYRNLAIGSGALWFVSWICLMLFSCRFRRMQQMMQAQMNQVNHQPYINNQAYQNNNNYPDYPNNNNYPVYPNNNANPYVQQPAQNNQYQNNTYNQPIAYVPPSSNAINRQ